MSRILPRLVAPLFVGLCTVGGSIPAFAADPLTLDRVEVSGGVRVDVRRTCPAIDDTLAENLARAVSRYGRDSDSEVRFELRADGIGAVSTQGGAFVYRPAIRHAVAQLQCQDQASAGRAQQFAFILSIRNSEQEGGAPKFAIRELPAQASAAP